MIVNEVTHLGLKVIEMLFTPLNAITGTFAKLEDFNLDMKIRRKINWKQFYAVKCKNLCFLDLLHQRIPFYKDGSEIFFFLKIKPTRQ